MSYEGNTSTTMKVNTLILCVVLVVTGRQLGGDEMEFGDGHRPNLEANCEEKLGFRQGRQKKKKKTGGEADIIC